MSRTTKCSPARQRPKLFDPLEQADFLRLKHSASLKGLLRPFKGKGELEAWASECEALRDGLIALAQRIVSQATNHPFNLLPVTLAQQTTGAGTAFLRWRSVDRSAMGVALWAQLIGDPNTPMSLAHELFALEQQRIALNMQISLTHSIARQAFECASKMRRAEVIFLRRVHDTRFPSPKESIS